MPLPQMDAIERLTCGVEELNGGVEEFSGERWIRNPTLGVHLYYTTSRQGGALASREYALTKTFLATSVLTSVAWNACSVGGNDAGWSGTATDSAGVSIIANTGEGLWGDGGWQVEQDVVIGEAEGDADYLFGHVSGICVGSAGELAVVDEASSSIRVYSSEGSLIRSFGGRGSGPGELGTALGPCLMGPGDTLLIPDLQNFRVSRYTLDGTSGRSTSFDIRRGIPVAWGVTRSGRVIAQLRYLGLLGDVEAGAPDALVQFEADGSVGDTLLKFEASRAVTMSSDGPSFEFLAPEPVWSLADDDGVLFGRTDEYRIMVHDREGRLTKILSKGHDRVPVTEDDRRSFVRAVEAVFPPGLVQQVMGDTQFAEYFPAFVNVQAGPSGTLWVQHMLRPSSLSEEERERLSFGPENPEVFLANPRFELGAPDWDVFDSGGRFLGVVVLPSRFEPVVFAGDRIYGIWRDDMDVERVMRLSIVGRG